MPVLAILKIILEYKFSVQFDEIFKEEKENKLVKKENTTPKKDS